MEIKKALLLFFLFFLCTAPFAQAQQTADDKEHDKHEKIVAARIAHISSKLNLSPEQAQKFWPVYNEFSTKRDKLRHQHRQVMQEVRETELTNDQARKAITDHIRYEKEEAALDDEYYGKKLQTVLEPRQIVILMKAEHEFKKMLLNRLKDHKAN